MKNTATNRVYARKTLAFIEAHPEVHKQDNWISGRTPEADETNFCGTSMCIAGTVNWLKHGIKTMAHRSESEGIRLLGLSEGEAEALFYEMDKGRAKAKLQKVADGVPFAREDFFTSDEDGEEPTFHEEAWNNRDIYETRD